MRYISVREILSAAVGLLVPSLALSQMLKPSETLGVSGYVGQIPVIQVDGRVYVEVESLARLTSGSMRFLVNHIILTFPSPENTAAPAANQPAQSGFSKDFLRAAVEEMTSMAEWRITIVNAIHSSFPVTDDWAAGYRRTADSKLALASAAMVTDSDRSGFTLLSNELAKLQALSDKYLVLRRSLTYIAPDSLDKDPLDQQVLTCARDLASLVAGGQFQDIPTCH